jgi:hypothetical protein
MNMFLLIVQSSKNEVCVLFRGVWQVIKCCHCHKESIITGLQQTKNTY